MNTLFTTLAAGAQSKGLTETVIMIALMMIIFWVLIIRPNRNRQKAMMERQASLKKGDNVITIGGMHGSINAVSDHTVSLKLGEGVFVKFDKSAIATIVDKTKSKDSKDAKK